MACWTTFMLYGAYFLFLCDNSHNRLNYDICFCQVSLKDLYKIYFYSNRIFLQLGIELTTYSLPQNPLMEEEKWQVLKDYVWSAFADQVAPALVQTIFYFLDNWHLCFCGMKFLLSYYSFISNFRATVQWQGYNYGLVPAVAISAFDTKIVNLCKSINNREKNDPALSLALDLDVAKSFVHLYSPVDIFWSGKINPFYGETKENLLNWTP